MQSLLFWYEVSVFLHISHHISLNQRLINWPLTSSLPDICLNTWVCCKITVWLRHMHFRFIISFFLLVGFVSIKTAHIHRHILFSLRWCLISTKVFFTVSYIHQPRLFASNTHRLINNFIIPVSQFISCRCLSLVYSVQLMQFMLRNFFCDAFRLCCNGFAEFLKWIELTPSIVLAMLALIVITILWSFKFLFYWFHSHILWKYQILIYIILNIL